jgi:hypothetical protein
MIKALSTNRDIDILDAQLMCLFSYLPGLKEMKLTTQTFVRCHRSYSANLRNAGDAIPVMQFCKPHSVEIRNPTSSISHWLRVNENLRLGLHAMSTKGTLVVKLKSHWRRNDDQ